MQFIRICFGFHIQKIYFQEELVIKFQRIFNKMKYVVSVV